MSSTELVIPYSGELVDLTNPGSCARALEEIRSIESRLREIKGVLTTVIVEEATRQGTKTLHFQDGDFSVSGGSTLEWDIEELEKLRDAGLPEERFYDLVKTVVSYKVNAAVAKQISGANPEYAAIIERARQEGPAPFRVSFKSS
jgi:hypothetical protein